MSANQFGSRFRITTFGESHGPAIGVVIDGCPAGLKVDLLMLQKEVDRRRPGADALVSDRKELDQIEILSGIYQGQTLGTPIALIVKNKDHRSQDYDHIANHPRVGHADDTWKGKFSVTDPRGGGRSSGRETVARVMAGYIARCLVEQSQGISAKVQVLGFAEQIGPLSLNSEELTTLKTRQITEVDSFQARFPSASYQNEVKKLLIEAKTRGESFGGTARINIFHPPLFIGQPVFHKLKSDLAMAMMSVGAVTGVEFGEGFAGCAQVGTEFHSTPDGQQYGGIRGGISTGEIISLRVAFKPTSSINDIAKKGRHDPCIIPRAIPVLESMVWLVLADHVLWQRTDNLAPIR